MPYIKSNIRSVCRSVSPIIFTDSRSWYLVSMRCSEFYLSLLFYCKPLVFLGKLWVSLEACDEGDFFQGKFVLQSKEITSVELFKAMQGLRVVCFFVVCFFNHPGNGSLGYKYTERVSCRISFSNLFISLWFSEYQGHVLFYNALVRDPWLGSFNFWFALTAKAFWWGASTLWRRVHDH